MFCKDYGFDFLPTQYENYLRTSLHLEKESLYT